MARINAFATAGSGVMLAGTDSGILVSRDRGMSWSAASVRLENPKSKTIAIVAHAGLAFAGTSDSGVLRSEDSGATWNQVRGFPHRRVLSLASFGNALFAGSDGNGVLVSADAGVSWSPAGDGLPKGAQVFELIVANGELFAALYAKGLYRWSAPGRIWTRCGQVTPLAAAAGAGTIVAGHNPGGLFWSADRGATWTRSQTPGSSVHAAEPVWKMAAGSGLVVAGVGDGTYLSIDGGRTFSRAGGGWPGASPGIAFLVEKDVVLAALIRSAIK